MSYVIQKMVQGEWVPAWGLTARSYPKAKSDAEAIEIFRKETARVRSPNRLIVRAAWGRSVGAAVLAEAGGGGLAT